MYVRSDLSDSLTSSLNEMLAITPLNECGVLNKELIKQCYSITY